MKATNTLRRFAFGAMTALALLAGSATVNQANACSSGVCVGELGTGKSVADAIVVGAVMGTITYFWGDFIIGSVYRDIKAGGLNRKFAEVVPGNGYSVQAADMSKITPAPKFAAVSTDLGAQQRALMVAQFNTAMTEQYASAAR